MNKKILISSWIMKHSRSDFSSLTFKLKDMMLHIHNVYLLLLKSLQNVNKDFLIYSLQQLLSRSDEYLLVRDFNVHHSMWKKTRCMKWHNMINNLIQIASKMNLTFLTSTDTIIRKFKNQINTLNLIFAMTEVTHRLVSCMMN